MSFQRSFLLPALWGLIATTVPAQASIKEGILDPVTPWRVDWSGDSCVLARAFGPAKHSTLLSMRSYAPGYDFDVTLARAPILSTGSIPRFTIAYGSGQPIPVKGYHVGSAKPFGRAIVFSSVASEGGESESNDGKKGSDKEKADKEMKDQPVRPYPDPAFEKQLDRISFATPFTRLILKTRAMAPVLDAMRKCTDNLVKQWGLDPSVQGSLSRRVELVNQKDWVGDILYDYPASLMMEGKGARTKLRVLIDEKGTPTKCDAFQAFTNTEFTVKACGIILKKARFMPALDRNGVPTPSFYTTRILYHLF